MKKIALVLSLLPAVLLAQTQAPLWPTSGWTAATPESLGVRGDALAAIDRDVKADVYGLVDRLFVAYKGRAIANYRYDRDYRAISKGRTGPLGCGYGCTDKSWMHEFNYYHPDYHPYFKGRDVHSLQSVTKSIAATLLGIALGRGEIASVDRPMVSFFPDRDLSRADPRLRRTTLEDVLTMRSGIEWHEQDRPMDSTNTTVQLEASKDWIAFTLAQPMDSDPGTKWAYNSGGSMLLSGIIKNATGKFIDDYAAEHLFQPLGIKDFYWKRTPTGHPDTEGGLYLGAEDLAKIGYLYLHGGVWNNRRILPAAFVERATTRHVTGVGGGQFDYGYQWWLTRRGDADVWMGRGFGGQFLIVIPSRSVVAVVNSWNIFGTPARNITTPLLDALVSLEPGRVE